MKIVLAYDTSDESKTAAKWAARLASGEAGSTVDVVGVVQTLEMAPETRDAVATTEHPDALETAVAAAAADIAKDAPTATVQHTVLAGNPAEQILDAASGADIIVMGKSGSHGMRRFLIGTVVERVTRHSETTVLIAQ